MAAFTGLFRRDLRLALRQGGDTGLVLGFFVLAVILFPLGIGPEPAVLQRIGADRVGGGAARRPVPSTGCSRPIIRMAGSSCSPFRPAARTRGAREMHRPLVATGPAGVDQSFSAPSISIRRRSRSCWSACCRHPGLEPDRRCRCRIDPRRPTPGSLSILVLPLMCRRWCLAPGRWRRARHRHAPIC